ncbi:MAG: LysR family transcriptional regulator, partial [Oscillospiraceae bacterium]|nr:LysR family transcriptional regulator [Oscillospiraceae bacterium]
MTIRHIKIFLALCDNGCNTTKTAEVLLMTQPAVSLAIKELEQYYGVCLFDRVGRRLAITEAGRRFWEYAGQISLLFDGMEKEMRDWDAFGLLRVGASITIGSQFLPCYVKAFYSRYPGTDVRVLIGPSEQLEHKLVHNELDLALIEGVPHLPSLVSEEYMEDRLIV